MQELSEEEKLVVMRSDNFRQFLDRTSRIIERAICEDVDIFIDYTGVQEESDRSVKFKVLLKFFAIFFILLLN